jgi:ribonuclease E
MLEHEPTGDAHSNASTDSTEHVTVGAAPGADTTTESTAAAPRRRRRAASRPAGPPEPVAPEAAEATGGNENGLRPADPPSATGPASDAAGSGEAAEPARTGRVRRSRKKAPAAEPAPAPAESAAAAEGGPVTARDATAEAPPEPEKPKRRRTRKQAPAAPADVTAGDEDPAHERSLTPAGQASHPEAEVETTSAVETGPEPEPEHAAGAAAALTFQAPTVVFQPPERELARPRTRKRAAAAPQEEPVTEAAETAVEAGPEGADAGEDSEDRASRRRRRGGRGRRGRGKGEEGLADEPGEDGDGDGQDGQETAEAGEAPETDEDAEDGASTRRRRRRRRRGGAAAEPETGPDDPPNTVVKIREPRKTRAGRAAEDRAEDTDEVQSIKGSTRLEAKKQRRREGREQGRRRAPIISEAEFLARRESVERVMVVRQVGGRTQIAVLEDGVLVEHYVNRETTASYVGNVYLGKVQNVLPSMEAAFVDIGKGRNAVLYAGEVNFDAAGLEGHPKRIESALRSGQSVLVQVTKDPMGHKGARLTSQISLPGRYLVYVPDGSMTGISRKLPDTERSRLKSILKKVVPDDAGVIVRTAAEGASEDELSRDVTRLAAQWEDIKRKSQTASPPALLYGEPDLTVRVIRDIFNEDFTSLVVSGDDAWDTVEPYLAHVAPDLVPRIKRWTPDKDVFADYRIDEQLMKALDRKVWLPSGGSLVIDRTEAMIVIDVNTGKFTGKGGNLEETVTKNNLEAAEEIVRQLRLRDLGGIIVIDFIDMVLESNRDLVLRRLLECLGRDRTKHQVAEVTSLGLVQMTRKRVGQGLLEAFSETCECCNGRGVNIRMEPVEQKPVRGERTEQERGRRRRGRGADKAAEPAAEAEVEAEVEPVVEAGGESELAAAADAAPVPGEPFGAAGEGRYEDDEEDEEDEELKPRSADDAANMAELLEPEVEPLSDGDEPVQRQKRPVKRARRKVDASAPAKKVSAKKTDKPAKRPAKRASTAPAEPE